MSQKRFSKNCWLGQTTSSERGILLIRREQPVPDSQDGGERWSLDHLFVDAEGVPILLEVKRSSDSRIRREVVGQMLDYAANGVAYWPIQHLIEMFAATCKKQGIDSERRLAEFLGAGRDAESFWRQVDANLRAGRVRMVFLADIIPQELQRIVEFLNEQMRPAEVLAIEVRQYRSPDGSRTLVPSLLGATERAQATKSISSTAESEDEWFEKFGQKWGLDGEAAARDIANELVKLGCQREVTLSGDSLKFTLTTRSGRLAVPFYIRRSLGNIEVPLQNLLPYSPFESDASRTALLARIQALPGVRIARPNIRGFPGFPAKDLEREDVKIGFLAIATDVVGSLGQ